MPSWRKIIVSGSDAQLNSLVVTTSVTASIISGSQITGSFSGSFFGNGAGLTNVTALSASYAATASSADAFFVRQYIDFVTQSVAPAPQEGRLFYDGPEFGLAYDNSIMEVHIGQETVLRVRNSTGVTLTKGSAVTINGALGDRPTVILAQSIINTGSFTLRPEITGIVAEDILTGVDGYIVTNGTLIDLSLFPTAIYTAGDVLYVSSSAGLLTNVAPSPPYDRIFAGIVTRANNGSAGRMYVSTRNPTHFHDITATSQSLQSQGDLWIFDSGSLTWKNSTILSGSYGLSGSIAIQSASIAVLTATGSFTGSFNGVHSGDGSGLTGIVATAAPAGPNMSVQFNDAGATSGSSIFTFDKTTDTVYLTGSLIVSNSLDTLLRTGYDSTGAPSFVWQQRNLIDSTGNTAIDWNNRLAQDNTGALSFDWQARSMTDSTTAPSIDWNNRDLYDGAGTAVVRWSSNRLYDTNNTISMQWGVGRRTLHDTNGTIALDYLDTAIDNKVRLYGTASYALTASLLLGSVGSAAQVETIYTSSTAVFYPTFVDSKNIIAAPETLYTGEDSTKGIYIIPDGAFGTTFYSYIMSSSAVFSTATPNTVGFIGTASWAVTSSNALTASYVNGINIKNNVVAGGTFAGNPKKVTITFTTAYPNTNYSITVTGEDVRTWTIESKLAGSFIINSNSNTALANNVYWQAIGYGEFTG